MKLGYTIDKKYTNPIQFDGKKIRGNKYILSRLQVEEVDMKKIKV